MFECSEQLLFSCVSSKVSICNHSLSLSLSHSLTHSHTLSISHSLTLDMLSKFCFHLYAQKSLFIGENCNAFFDLLLSSTTRSTDIRVHRAGSQLIIIRYNILIIHGKCTRFFHLNQIHLSLLHESLNLDIFWTISDHGINLLHRS